MANPLDEYLSTEQFRRLCGLSSRQSVTAAIRANRLDAIKREGRYFIHRNAIIRTNRTGEFVGRAARLKESKLRRLKEGE
jgi:hypothetical protein